MIPALAAALLAPVAVQAAPVDPLAGAWLVQVRPGPRRYFYEEAEGGRMQRTAAYVVAGDRLVARATRAGFTSVTFVAANSRPRRGWIASAGVTRIAAPASGWRGEWTGGDATIRIEPGKRRAALRLIGSATWGSHDPGRVARGGVNIGDFDLEVAAPRADRVAFSIGDAPAGKTGSDMVARPFAEAPESFRCRVALRLLGPYLLAEDNNQCGGHNVTFTATYRRKP